MSHPIQKVETGLRDGEEASKDLFSLANPSRFWFLLGRMTRQRITGCQIKLWREGLSKPRRWLAERLDVSPKTIESWEYETRSPGGPALLLLEHLMMSLPPEQEHEQQKRYFQRRGVVQSYKAI